MTGGVDTHEFVREDKHVILGQKHRALHSICEDEQFLPGRQRVVWLDAPVSVGVHYEVLIGEARHEWVLQEHVAYPRDVGVLV